MVYFLLLWMSSASVRLWNPYPIQEYSPVSSVQWMPNQTVHLWTWVRLTKGCKRHPPLILGKNWGLFALPTELVIVSCFVHHYLWNCQSCFLWPSASPLRVRTTECVMLITPYLHNKTKSRPVAHVLWYQVHGLLPVRVVGGFMLSCSWRRQQGMTWP